MTDAGHPVRRQRRFVFSEETDAFSSINLIRLFVFYLFFFFFSRGSGEGAGRDVLVKKIIMGNTYERTDQCFYFYIIIQ